MGYYIPRSIHPWNAVRMCDNRAVPPIIHASIDLMLDYQCLRALDTNGVLKGSALIGMKVGPGTRPCSGSVVQLSCEKKT